jgi:cobalt-zinc-cadmium efflux system membrane fusion protein
MKKIILYSYLLFGTYSGLFISCNKPGKNNEKSNPASGDSSKQDSINTMESSAESLVEISEQKFKNSGIELGTLEERNLKDMVRCNGILTLPPQNKAHVSSLVAGTVKNVFVIEGDLVKKGKVLANLLSTEAIRIQEEYIKAKGTLGYMEMEYRRQQELLNQNVTSGKKYQQAEADYTSEKGRVNSLRDQLVSIGLSPKQVGEGNTTTLVPVIAPIDGYVRKIDINIGTFVVAAKEMFEIVDLHHIHIDLQVFENDFSKIGIGQKVYVTLPNQEKGLIEATVFATGKAFENDSRSVTIHAEINNNKNKSLIPGMYVNAFIETGMHKVPAVPLDAVITNGGKQYIFVFKEKKKEATKMVYLFEMKEVKTGITEEGFIEIIPLEDIASNSQLVFKGAYFLASELKKGEGGDHHH